ncbi:DUF4059 family protein [Streptococcus cristatus]|uniref:DUF4059 family protein n=1 Tax=Streptococcus cristatus TaxID=45634 RepID=UPI0039C06B82
MLIKIFSLYIQSLIYTTIMVGLADGLWLLLQRLGRKDRTLAVGQSQIYDLLLITIMTIPILSFAIFGLLVVLKA